MKTEKDIFNKKQQPENIQSYQVFSVLSLTVGTMQAQLLQLHISLQICHLMTDVKPTEDIILSEGKNDCMHKLKYHNHNAVEDLGNNVTAGNTGNVKINLKAPLEKNLNYR